MSYNYPQRGRYGGRFQGRSDRQRQSYRIFSADGQAFQTNTGRGQKRSRDEDHDNEDSLRANQELPSKRAYRRDGSFQGDKKKLPGGFVEHQEEILPEKVAIAKEIITRLGDFTRLTPEDNILANITAAAAVFSSEDNLGEDADSIAELFNKALSTLPIQIPIIGTLLALISRTDESFASMVVSKLEKSLISSIGNGDIHSAKLILRSFAVLSSAECIEPSHMISILQGLFDVVTNNIDASDNSRLDDVSMVALYILSSTIPWAMTALCNYNDHDILLLLQEYFSKFIESYVSRFDVSGSKHSLFYAYYEIPQPETDADNPDDTNMSKDPYHHVLSIGPQGACCWDNLIESVVIALDFIQSALNVATVVYPPCMSAYWTELDSLPDRQTNLITISEQTVQIMKTLLRHPTIESLSYSSTKVPWLLPKFYLFDVSSVSAPSGTIKCFELLRVEKHIVASYYVDVLHFFDPIMNIDGTMKGSLDLLCDHLLAISRTITRDYSDGSTPGPNEALHLEFLICETLLQMLAVIPSHCLRNMAISRVLLELQKKKTAEFSSAIALGALLLYQMLPSMDYTVIHEYSKWLSFHLANISLSWPYWDHWVSELTAEEEVDQTTEKDMQSSSHVIGYGSIGGLFCRQVVDRLTRIFVPNIVMNSLPPAIHCWVPSVEDALTVHVDFRSTIVPKGIVEATSNPSINDQLAFVGAKIRGFIANNDANEVVEAFLDNPNDVLDSSFMAEIWRSALLFKSVLSISGQLLSLLTNVTEKYSAALRSFGSSTACQNAMIKSLAEAFSSNGGVFRTILDIMVRRGIIQPYAIADWLVSLEDSVDDDEPSKTPVSGLHGLATDLHVYHVVEIVCDRAMDFVKASIAARKAFGHDMILDESLDVFSLNLLANVESAATTVVTTAPLRPTDTIESSETVINNLQTDNDYDEADGLDDGRAGLDRPSHRVEGDARDILTASDAVEVMIEDDDSDPKTQATEALLSALFNSRSVYRTIVSYLLQHLVPLDRAAYSGEQTEQQDVEGDDDERGDRRESTVTKTDVNVRSRTWGMVALSLLRRILRSFHDTEKMLNLNLTLATDVSYEQANVVETYHSRIVLSDGEFVRQKLDEFQLTAEETSLLPSVVTMTSFLN